MLCLSGPACPMVSSMGTMSPLKVPHRGATSFLGWDAFSWGDPATVAGLGVLAHGAVCVGLGAGTAEACGPSVPVCFSLVRALGVKKEGVCVLAPSL